MLQALVCRVRRRFGSGVKAFARGGWRRVALAAALFAGGLSLGSPVAAESLATVRMGRGVLTDPGVLPDPFRNASSPTAGARDPLVNELARSLGYDVDQIFQHVRDHVEFTPIYGLKKGARGVAIDGWGTAFDQAQFMVDALREADAKAGRGYQPRYVHGQIELQQPQFAAWFGVTDAAAARRVLADGGIPATVIGDGASFSVTMRHVWVKARIGGVDHVFDPSYKPHVRTPPSIDVAAKMQYSRGDLLAAASGGTDATVVSGLNRNAVRDKLTEFRGKLETYLANPANGLVGAKVDAVVGRSTIVPHAAEERRRVNLSYATGAADPDWSGQVPDVYRTRVTVQVSNWTGPVTLFADEIYAKPLAFAYRSLGTAGLIAPPAPQVTLGANGAGRQCSQFNDAAVAAPLDVTVSVDHPYPNNAALDHTVVKRITWRKCVDGEFVLTSDFGDISPQAAALMRQDADDYKYDRFRNRDMMIGPTLANVASQYSEFLRLSGKVRSGVYQLHDLIGVHQVQHAGLEIDNANGTWVNFSGQEMLAMHFEAVVSGNPTDADDSGRRRALQRLAVGGLAIAESAVARQEADAERDVTALSLLTREGAIGAQPLYVADASNWSSTILPLLQNYSVGARDVLQAYVTEGYKVLVPQQGSLSQDTFSVTSESGFVRRTRLMETVPYIDPVDQVNVSAQALRRSVFAVIHPVTGDGALLIYDPRTRSITKGGIDVTVGDPTQIRRPDAPKPSVTDGVLAGISVDPKSGGLTYAPAPDLSDGVGEFPQMLSFERRYSAGDGENQGLGSGWRHNWWHAIVMNNDGHAALGGSGAFGAASVLVAIQATADLADSMAPRELLTSANAQRWMVDQTMNNAVIVKSGFGADQTFLRMADGVNFMNTSPDGSRLVQSGAGVDNVINRRAYHGVSFIYTAAGGDRRTYPYPLREGQSTSLWEPSTVSRLTRKTFPMTEWTFPSGVRVSTKYEVFGPFGDSFLLKEVKNNLGARLAHTVYKSGDSVGIVSCQTLEERPTLGENGYENSAGRIAKYTLTAAQARFPGCNGDPQSIEEYRQFLRSFTDPTQRTWRYEDASVQTSYGGQSVLSKIFKPTSPAAAPAATVTLGFDGRVRTVANAMGDTWSHYASPHRYGLTTHTAVGQLLATSATYFDEYGRGVRALDANGEPTVTAYDGRDRVVRVTQPEGNAEAREYDIRGNLVKTCQIPKNRKDQACSAQAGDLVVVADYPHDDVLTCPDADRATCNRPVSVTDARGKTTDYSWNAQGYAWRVEKPADIHGQRPRLEFEFATYAIGADTLTLPVVRKEKVSATRTDKTSIHYDAGNRYVVDGIVVDPDGAIPLASSFHFSPLGDLESIDGPLTGSDDKVSFEWDEARRLKGVVEADPDGAGGATLPVASRYSYTPDGTLEYVERGTQGATFNRLEWTRFEYDPAGRQARQTIYEGATNNVAATITDFTYDALDRVVCTAIRMTPNPATAAGGACTPTAGAAVPDRVSRTIYDLRGNPCRVQRGVSSTNVGTAPSRTPAGCPADFYSALATEEFRYTRNGEREAVYDANFNKTTLAYDGFDRLARQTFPVLAPAQGASQADDFEAYDYDENGNRTQLTKRDGRVINFQYDDLNRLKIKDLPGTDDGDVYYDYDLAGRMTAALYGGLAGQGTRFTYDYAGRLETDTTFGFQLTSGYNKAGVRNRLSFADGFSVTYDRDAAGRLSRLRETGVESGDGVLAAFEYEGLGRPWKIKRDDNRGIQTVFGYDGAGRLKSLEHGGVAAYAQSVKFNAASQIEELTQTNSNYVYSGSPPLVRSRAYDGLNRDATFAVLSDGYDDNGNLTNDGARRFTYDVENRLTKVRPVEGQGGVTTDLTYDPTGRLATTKVTTTSGETTTRFRYDGDRLVGEYTDGGTVLRRYIHGDGVDNPLVWYQGAERRWLYGDRQGSIVGYSAAGGAVTPYSFSPWGEPTAWDMRFAYTGQIALPEAQLYHYKARAYDPVLGRFLQTDPVGFDGGDLNLYAYVKGDPTNATDPSGQVVRKAGRLLAEDILVKFLKRIGDKAVKQAWKEEQRLVRETGQGTRRWTDAQKKELLEEGKVKGFQGHHINDKANYPSMAGNPNNIEFLTEAEHKAAHAATGGTRGTTSGPLVDRTAGGRFGTTVFKSNFIMSLAGAAFYTAQVADIFDPISAATDPEYGTWKTLEDAQHEAERPCHPSVRFCSPR